MILTPAYNRDYKSKAEVLRDFSDNKDFLLQPQGCPINRPQVEEEGLKSVTVRYTRLTKVLVLGRLPNGTWTVR